MTKVHKLEHAKNKDNIEKGIEKYIKYVVMIEKYKIKKEIKNVNNKKIENGIEMTSSTCTRGEATSGELATIMGVLNLSCNTKL